MLKFEDWEFGPKLVKLMFSGIFIFEWFWWNYRRRSHRRLTDDGDTDTVELTLLDVFKLEWFVFLHYEVQEKKICIKSRYRISVDKSAKQGSPLRSFNSLKPSDCKSKIESITDKGLLNFYLKKVRWSIQTWNFHSQNMDFFADETDETRNSSRNFHRVKTHNPAISLATKFESQNLPLVWPSLKEKLGVKIIAPF